ncbi:MAG: aminoacyl-tRNA hydrolase [Candidatus Shapirobacteria bacterium]|nr:aminoacyl-tRNA hydrolase [Candidatus Shapirobacteria bacterium]
MKLIIGLGNPDKKYANNRHNIGHLVIDQLPAQKNFLKTDGYMNESGIFVQKQVNFYKINLSDLYIIHDDLDLPVGEWRLQFDRGPAGHHGVESVIQHLGSQAFNRIRIGIGHPEFGNVEDYVLKPFTADEKKIISETIDKIVTEITDLMGS